MIAHSFGELLSSLGVDQSYSRPRVSNDNAFSESQFKTTKYWPSYPGRFNGIDHSRQWCREFFPAYQKRSHQGLALFTPMNVYAGQLEAVWQVRQAAMNRHYGANPGCYVKGSPKVARPPSASPSTQTMHKRQVKCLPRKMPSNLNQLRSASNCPKLLHRKNHRCVRKCKPTGTALPSCCV